MDKKALCISIGMGFAIVMIPLVIAGTIGFCAGYLAYAVNLADLSYLSVSMANTIATNFGIEIGFTVALTALFLEGLIASLVTGR